MREMHQSKFCVSESQSESRKYKSRDRENQNNVGIVEKLRDLFTDVATRAQSGN